VVAVATTTRHRRAAKERWGAVDRVRQAAGEEEPPAIRQGRILAVLEASTPVVVQASAVALVGRVRVAKPERVGWPVLPA
jgi:hypothetical protein